MICGGRITQNQARKFLQLLKSQVSANGECVRVYAPAPRNLF